MQYLTVNILEQQRLMREVLTLECVNLDELWDKKIKRIKAFLIMQNPISVNQ